MSALAPMLVLGSVLVLAASAAAGASANRQGTVAPDVRQSESYDPVFPAHERWAAMPCAAGAVAIAAVPDDATLLSATPAELADRAALARFTRLRQLWIGPGSSPEPIPAGTLRAVAALPSLEFLCLFFRVTPEALRELRSAPRLTTLVLFHRSLVFDAGLAEALAELPRLSSLGLLTAWTATGVEGLGSLSHLESLQLVSDAHVPPAALAKLRRLRALSIDGYPPMGSAFTAEQMLEVAKLPRIASLRLSGLALDDATLACLPRTLQSLELVQVRGPTAAGLRSLAELPNVRSFALGVMDRSDETRAAEIALVRALPLERFGAPIEADSPMWDSLAEKRQLRVLTLSPVAGELDLAPCSRLHALEQLRLDFPRTLAPETVAPLKGHPALKQIVTTGPVLAPEQILAFRRALGPRIELVTR